MSWEDLFRENTEADVRAKHTQLLAEKHHLQQEASSALGAAHPEILNLCASIKQLGPAANQYQAAISGLSSVKNTERWSQLSQCAARYATTERNIAKKRALQSLVGCLLDNLSTATANGELVTAARTHYLLELLNVPNAPKVLDNKLSLWLHQPDADNNAILAYIIRYKVSPSQLATELARKRLEMLHKLDLLSAVELVEQTIFTLEYISDYGVKFKRSSARLVDSLRVNQKILPPQALQAPLYPEQCFQRHPEGQQIDFRAKADEILLDLANSLITSSSSEQVVQVYGFLLRDSPKLAGEVRSACKARIEALATELMGRLQAIKLPSTIDSDFAPLTLHQSELASRAVKRAHGESGSISSVIEDTRSWQANLSALKSQIKSLGLLKSRDPELGPVCEALEQAVDSQADKAIALRLEHLSSNPTVDALFVKALQPQATQLSEIYDKLCNEILSHWDILTSAAQIAPFPRTSLLNSMLCLAGLMDTVAVGFEWDEGSLKHMRKNAYEKLIESFPDEHKFLDTAFGHSQEDRTTLDRVRTLLLPLVV